MRILEGVISAQVDFPSYISMNLGNAADDDFDEDEIRRYYVERLPILHGKHLHLIPTSILREIAVMIHSKLLFEAEWRDFAVLLGIQDNLTLDRIEASARVSKELPLYVALNTPLPGSRTLGQVIEALLQRQRFDILHHIRSFVQNALEKKSATKVKRLVSTEEQSCGSSINNLNCTSETINNFQSLSINSEVSENNDVSENTISVVESVHFEINALQQNRVRIDCTPALQILESPEKEELISDTLEVLPSAPPEESIIVLIQHAESENSIAEQLSSMLRKEGINVKLFADLEYLVMMDSAGALSAVLNEVDFIVPVVSEKFLEEVHPRVDVKYLESPFTMNNRNLYQLIMNEYRFDRCINFRVRPVIVPNLNRKLLKSDLILCQALRLWAEVPKLINVLKKTKELIPKYPFH